MLRDAFGGSLFNPFLVLLSISSVEQYGILAEAGSPDAFAIRYHTLALL